MHAIDRVRACGGNIAVECRRIFTLANRYVIIYTFKQVGYNLKGCIITSDLDSDPDSIRSVDPDSRSGSRMEKVTHKNIKKLRNFIF
jgi:hypothetical protein